ncbi:hypothetical protein NC653_019195 [Populus alba x Populus x berolinensis]|uniref:Uncharacterized protein n=2 Tax=Populus TaxID=3689 RepID=A0A4U5MW95_POPAL|nr:hypothetical protein NC653_019195 [Populus alba x Populus x berolinensis]TKR74159.1 hypothetical protein D5086_0000297620 [Populus alba]
MNATEASSSFVVPIAADHPIHNSFLDGPQEPEPPDAFVGWRRRLAVNPMMGKRSSSREDWAMAFGIAIWQIWKDLNKRVFGNEQRKCNGTVGAIQRLVTDMQMANVESNAEKTRKQQPMNK